MKKIITLIMLIFNSLFIMSCEELLSIDRTNYIDSLGIDYNSETKEFTIYYHLITSNSLVTTELGSASTEDTYSVGKTNDSSIYEAIKKIEVQGTQSIVLTHISSVIVSFDFITNKNLNMLCEVIKTYDQITPNFYIFATESSLDDIFAVESPEAISPFFSIINTTDSLTDYKLVYFTELSRSITENFLITKIIVIESFQDIWKKGDKNIISIAPIGDLYLKDNDELTFIKVNEYKALILFNHYKESVIVFNDINYHIYNNQISFSEKDGVFMIKLKGNIYASNVYKSSYNDVLELFEENIQKEFKKLINYTKENNIDIFNLQDILYRKNKLKGNFDYKAAEIKFDLNYKLLN